MAPDAVQVQYEGQTSSSTTMTSRCSVLLWCVCVVLGAALFYGIVTPPLREYRESIQAEMGREMLFLQDYLVPHLNQTPHLDKPPLVPWVVALTFKVFGVTQGAARVPSVVAILWTAGVAGWLAYRIFGPGAGWLAAVLLLGAPWSYYYGRMLMTDTIFVALNVTALAAFVEGYVREQRSWYRLGFLVCGLAVLTRGLIGIVYPLGTLAMFFALLDRQAWRRVPWGSGLALFLLVTVPWFGLMELRYPGFSYLFFVQHHVHRLNPAVAHTFVALPRWQIVLGFVGYFGPLGLLLPWTMTTVRGVRSTHALLWLMALAVIASVLVSTGRNHPYMLPAIPPLVVLVAGWLVTTSAHGPVAAWRVTALLVGCLGAAVLGSLVWMAGILGMLSPLLSHPTTQLTLQVCLALTGIFILAGSVLLWQRRGVAAGVVLAVMMVPSAYMLTHVQLRLAPLESRAALADIVAREVPASWPIIIANPRDRLFEGVGGWGFYTRRQVRMVALHSPVLGPFQGVSRPEWIMDKQELLALLHAGRPLALLATPQAIEQLPMLSLPAPRARDAQFSLWLVPPRVQAASLEPKVAWPTPGTLYSSSPQGN